MQEAGFKRAHRSVIGCSWAGREINFDRKLKVVVPLWGSVSWQRAQGTLLGVGHILTSHADHLGTQVIL
jgi:hypothetical protein